MEEPLSSGEFLLLIILFIFSAFFSSSETAFLSVNKFKLERLAKEGNKNAKLALKLLENPQRLITTILIGNNLVNIAAASISAAIATKLLGNLGLGIATAIVTIITIIFGEVLPKNFALRHSEKLVLLFAKPLYFFQILFFPLSWILIKMTEKLFPKKEELITEEEIKVILEHSHKNGVLDYEEKEIIENVLELDNTYINEIMTPKNKIVAIEEDKPIKEALKLVEKTGFSKIPTYSKTIDNITGVIYLKDILKNLNKNIKVKDIRKNIFYFREDMKADELFKEMRKNKTKIAVVIDKRGKVRGIITLTDIMDYIVETD